MMYLSNNCWHFNIYELDQFHAQLSWAWQIFIALLPGIINLENTLFFWFLRTDQLSALFFLLFFFTSQTTVFQLFRDGSSLDEPVRNMHKCVLLKDTTQWRRWDSNPRPLGLESSTIPMSHCALYYGRYDAKILKPTNSYIEPVRAHEI